MIRGASGASRWSAVKDTGGVAQPPDGGGGDTVPPAVRQRTIFDERREKIGLSLDSGGLLMEAVSVNERLTILAIQQP